MGVLTRSEEGAPFGCHWGREVKELGKRVQADGGAAPPM